MSLYTPCKEYCGSINCLRDREKRTRIKEIPYKKTGLGISFINPMQSPVIMNNFRAINLHSRTGSYGRQVAGKVL